MGTLTSAFPALDCAASLSYSKIRVVTRASQAQNDPIRRDGPAYHARCLYVEQLVAGRSCILRRYIVAAAAAKSLNIK